MDADKQTIKERICEILSADERLAVAADAENKHAAENLNWTKIWRLAERLDERVIGALLQNPTLKAKFFVQIQDALVFKLNDFRFFIEENKLDNSYTRYQNRIGLTDGGRYLRDSADVVLDWPYKDCVLEGGQSTEEGEDAYFELDKDSGEYEEKRAKRKEIFFNQTLAADEIDRLTDAKAFANWRRYNKDGEQEVGKLKREDGAIRENLIIKGNNYIALHSLLRQFAGKIKLIYIDPPYNTGGDANIFTYNNNFNHSTWLTFMKNRLEVARELLRDDGFIAIAIDHNELFYLGALADEIFGSGNRLGVVSIAHKPGGVQFAKLFSNSNDFMLVYSKNNAHAEFRTILNEEDKIKFDKQDANGLYREEKFMRDFDPDATKENKPQYWYPIYVSEDLRSVSLQKIDGYHEVLPISSTNRKVTWNQKKDTFIDNYNKGEIFVKRDNGEIHIVRKVRAKSPVKTLWTDKRYDATSQGTKLLTKIFGERPAFSYPKSLYTVLDTLKIMTSADDIILDFHAGSGTTGHAALALNQEDGGNRKFILVEQLDEHIEVCIERNLRVLAQENIGTSFVYCELAKWNEAAKAQINACKNLEDLEDFFDEMVNRYFLNYNLKIKEFQERTLAEEAFRVLPLSRQKQMFLTMLDLNQMYVNATEMADSLYNISVADQKLTKEFYGE